MINQLFAETEGPFFYIPYNAHCDVMDHPSGGDLLGTYGNCFGETQMFLQRINGTIPTFNTICPERNLINSQLNQLIKTVGANDKS